MDAPAALCQVNSYDGLEVRTALCEMFELLGGLGRFVKNGQHVLIKPNIIAARPLSQTHPAVIIELAKLIRQAGCSVAVADSPGWGSIASNAAASGLLKAAQDNDIPLFQLSQPVKTDNPAGRIYKTLTVSRQSLEPDVVINVPKLKTHQQLKLTAGVKNMFGVVPGKRKAWWHCKAASDRHFAMMIVETYLLIKPALTIIDAIDAMEGRGPIRGTSRRLGALIGSPDAFAAELVAARLVNCDPADLPIVCAGQAMGVAPQDTAGIEVLGTDVETLAVSDFEFPRLMPVMFSPPRVLASVLKQAWMLCTGRRGS